MVEQRVLSALAGVQFPYGVREKAKGSTVVATFSSYALGVVVAQQIPNLLVSVRFVEGVLVSLA